MKKHLANFLSDESGATAIEYALIAAIIGIGIIGSLRTVTPELNAVFTDSADALADAR